MTPRLVSMVGADHTPAPEGPKVGVPSLVVPVFLGASIRKVFQTTEPSRTCNAVRLPRKVQQAYCGSSERVSSHDAAGVYTIPAFAVGDAVRGVALLSSMRRRYKCVSVYDVSEQAQPALCPKQRR